MPGLPLRVVDIMTVPVVTLHATQSLPLAASVMELGHVRHLPVVDDDGKLVGLVTHRDLLAASISALTPLTKDERSTLELVVPVSRLMQTEVWTVQPTALAATAARLMRDHHFGCLPVVDGGKVVGIVTESDLLTLVLDSVDPCRAPVPRTVEAFMTPSPVTIDSTASIADARRLMDAMHVRHLPVVDAGRPVDLVSERDLRVAESVYPDPKAAQAKRAIDLLGREGRPRVAPRDPLDAVLLDMADKKLDAVMVVDDGRLVGILTAVDACRVLGQHLRVAHTTSA